MELVYFQIHRLIKNFNEKYRKDKWEALNDTGFLKSNTDIFLYKGNREIIISRIFEDKITNYGNYTMSEEILNDYFNLVEIIQSILIDYWYGGKEY